MIGSLMITLYLAACATNGKAKILISLDGDSYEMTVSIGTNRDQTLKAIIDTDSPLTKFDSSLYQQCLSDSSSNSGRRIFDGVTRQIRRFVNDTITLCGVSDITLPKHTFAIVEGLECENANVLGMSRTGLQYNGTKAVTLFETGESLLQQLTFVFWGPGLDGVMAAGDNHLPEFCDPTTRAEVIAYPGRWWLFTIDSMEVNDFNGSFLKSSFPAVVTPASPYIIFPPAIHQKVIEKVGLSVAGSITCGHRTLLPPLQFTIAGKKMQVFAKDYISEDVDGNCKFLIRSTVGTKYEERSNVILGIPFLQGRCFHLNNIDGTVAFSKAVEMGIEFFLTENIF